LKKAAGIMCEVSPVVCALFYDARIHTVTIIDELDRIWKEKAVA
jgi:hypothetical protein